MKTFFNKYEWQNTDKYILKIINTLSNGESIFFPYESVSFLPLKFFTSHLFPIYGTKIKVMSQLLLLK